MKIEAGMGVMKKRNHLRRRGPRPLGGDSIERMAARLFQFEGGIGSFGMCRLFSYHSSSSLITLIQF